MNFYLIWEEWLIAASLAALLSILICLIRRQPLGRTLGWTSFAAYLTAVPALTLLPFPARRTPLSFEELKDGISWMPVIPLLDSWSIVQTYLGRGDSGPLHTFLWNNLGNFFIFIPLALYLHLFFRQSTLRSFLACLAASLIIELLQAILVLYTGVLYRVIDINDVILNSLGALTALFLAWLFRRIRRGRRPVRKQSRQPKKKRV